MADHPDGLQDLVTRAHVARRLHLTRGQLERAVSAHDFPAPVGRLGAWTVWRWSDVRRWAEGARGRPEGPTDEAMHVAGIRDRFRATGSRLKIIRHPDGGWQAIQAPMGGASARGQVFRGATRGEAADRALSWLETHK
jgi:hypothetical protein